mgnify:CR=1 FL=1
MVEFCINCALNSPFSFIWFYLHPRPHIWHIKPICDVNEEKILKIAIFDILVVLWAYNCLWQLPADWKIKNFCCHTKTLRSIITLSNVAVSFTIIRACVYQIWGLGCKWFKSYDRKRDFTLFWKLTGSFCTAVLRKIRFCFSILSKRYSRPMAWHINSINSLVEIAMLKTCLLCTSFRSILQKPLFFRLSGPLTEHIWAHSYKSSVTITCF